MDLVRVAHTLDLASPSMAATINAALESLETLMRIRNKPSGQGGGPKEQCRGQR